MSTGQHELEGYVRPNLETVATPISGARPIQETSTRRKRRVFTFAVTAFLFGAMLIMFNSPIREDILAPGPLSQQHAQILKGSTRCQACHQNGHQSFSGWIANLFGSGADPDGHGQSERCMDCHQTTIDIDRALSPHNQPLETLAALGGSEKNSGAFQLASFSSSGTLTQVACRNCHREHHGNDDINALTDRQCQVCHGETYHSFETDHPEFNGWPFARESRIAFDHVSHSQKHFAEKGAEFSCSRCHVPDGFGNVQLMSGYEKSCSECHESGLQMSADAGLTLLQLPMLDVDELKENGSDVGSWPVGLTGEYDGGIPPLMRLLLAADPKTAEGLARLGADFEFIDVDPSNADSLKDVEQVVWGIKRLCYELGSQGIPAMFRRIEQVIERPLTLQEKSLVSAGLSDAALREMSGAWFPRLGEELATWDPPVTNSNKIADWGTGRIFGNVSSDLAQDDQLADNPLKRLMATSENDRANPSQPLRSQQPTQSQVIANSNLKQPVSEMAESLTELPTGDDARPLRELSETSASPPRISPPAPTENTLANNPLARLMAGQVSRPDPGKQAATTNSVVPLKVLDPAASRPEIKVLTPPKPGIRIPNLTDRTLIENPLPRMLIANQPDQALPEIKYGQESGQSLSSKGGDSMGAGLDQPKVNSNDGLANASKPSGESPRSERISNGAKASATSGRDEAIKQLVASSARPLPIGALSGWFRDDRFYQIRYEPHGHADPVVRGWTELALARPQADKWHATQPAFELLTKEMGPGQCRTCHTAEQKSDGSFIAHWYGNSRNSAIKQFTRFNHAPHLTISELRDCSGCHSMDNSLKNAEYFKDFDPKTYVSNFQPMKKADCATCHREGQAPNGCSDCHYYHVGSPVRN